MGLDYVDIFYSHRADPDTPLEETMGAPTPPSGRARRFMRGSPLFTGRTDVPRKSSADWHPLTIHQPSYSILDRWIESGLLDVLGDLGIGCIVFTPLAQGMLTDRYLDGIPRIRGLPGTIPSTLTG